MAPSPVLAFYSLRDLEHARESCQHQFLDIKHDL